MLHTLLRSTWTRRCLTVPGTLTATALLWATAPAWLLLVPSCELILRTPHLSRTRSLLALTGLLTMETAGIVASTALWVLHLGRVGSPASQRHHLRLQGWWAQANYRIVWCAFSLRLEVESIEQGARGPYLLFVRHASLADTLLASVVLSGPHGMAFRYVLKRELLLNPCLDIVGNRLPNLFVARAAGDRAQQVRDIAHLAQGVQGQSGLLIYPEGTRFSPGKLRRILSRKPFADQPALAQLAQQYRNVLPPRLGGVTALLQAAPEMDVVFLEHVGLEKAVKLNDFWGGRIIGEAIRVRVRRVPAGDIPRDAPAQWLFAQWKTMDDWVTAHKLHSAQRPCPEEPFGLTDVSCANS